MQTLFDEIPVYFYFKDKNRRFVRASKYFKIVRMQSGRHHWQKDEDLFPAEIAVETADNDRGAIESGIPLVNKEEGGESIGDGGHGVLTTKMPWRDKKDDKQRNCLAAAGIPKAVSFHIGNILKKLGLGNQKMNLYTYLQSFPDRHTS